MVYNTSTILVVNLGILTVLTIHRLCAKINMQKRNRCRFAADYIV